MGQFESRFQDCIKNHRFFFIFATPFSVNIYTPPANFQMESTQLQADTQLK